MKLSIFGAAAILICAFVIFPCRMSGNNMFPMVKDGDLCLMYRLGGYHTGDVVLYTAPDQSRRMGRIAASGGETAASDIYPEKIPEGMYFIMNDFSSDTKDSREFGLVSRKDLKGKIVFILRRRSF